MSCCGCRSTSLDATRALGSPHLRRKQIWNVPSRQAPPPPPCTPVPQSILSVERGVRVTFAAHDLQQHVLCYADVLMSCLQHLCMAFTAVCMPLQSAEHVIEGVMVKINRAGPRPEHEHPPDEKPQTAPSVASFTVRH